MSKTIILTLVLSLASVFGFGQTFEFAYSVNGNAKSTVALFNESYDETIYFKPTDNFEVLSVKYGGNDRTESITYKLKNSAGEYADPKSNIHDHLNGVGQYEILVIYSAWYSYLTININNSAAIGEIVNDQISVYPNPVKDILHILCNEPVELYSMDGQLILTTNDKMIDMSDYKTGIYFLKSGSSMTKIIKN